VLPELQELYDINVNRPLVKFLTGEKGYAEAMDDVYFDSSAGEIYILVNDLELYNPPEPKYRNAMHRKQIFTSLVCNNGENITEFNKRDNRELRKTTSIPSSIVEISTDMIIYQDKILFGTLQKESFAATLVRSKPLHKTFKSMIVAALTDAS
jgi:hypothetical protein